jgi:four helix bundle protein
LQNGETTANKCPDLAVRSKEFALRVIRLYQALPDTNEARIIGKQILRSGTSVGAQYREAKRARTKIEFQAKIEGALQELEETGYWLELLGEANIFPTNRLASILQEQKELTAMLIASANTSKQHK